MCPKGDDPLTTSTNRRSIVINTTVVGDDASGYFTVWYERRAYVLPVGADNEVCAKLFEGSRAIETVQCTITLQGGEYTAYEVEFQQFPMFPYQNNIFHHEGDIPIGDFYCTSESVINATFASCDILDVAKDPATYAGMSRGTLK